MILNENIANFLSKKSKKVKKFKNFTKKKIDLKISILSKKWRNFDNFWVLLHNYSLILVRISILSLILINFRLIKA